MDKCRFSRLSEGKYDPGTGEQVTKPMCVLCVQEVVCTGYDESCKLYSPKTDA